jgi:hypothetical protein
MNTTHCLILVAEIPGYAKLQREIHDALRAQHPEWIEADGNSPTCDSYESRLAELLTLSLATEACTRSNEVAVSRSKYSISASSTRQYNNN